MFLLYRNEKIRNFVGYSGRITGILSGLTVVTDYNPDDAVDGTIIHAGALKVSFLYMVMNILKS